MNKRVVLAVLAAAAVAVSPAFAAKKKDTYELKGTLSAYTAAVDTTPGSVTILVTKSNKAGRPFVGQTLTFAVDATTRVKVKGGAIVDGDHGDVQVKGAPGLDATGLQLLTPKQVVEKTGS
jgi:outer membrane receptor for ferrienterochelin and colicin